MRGLLVAFIRSSSSIDVNRPLSAGSERIYNSVRSTEYLLQRPMCQPRLSSDLGDVRGLASIGDLGNIIVCMPIMDDVTIILTMSTWSAFATSPWRSLHYSARRRVNSRTAYRCVSCSIRQWQKAGEEVENGRTTHFGFDTISESQKEQKGEYRAVGCGLCTRR